MIYVRFLRPTKANACPTLFFCRYNDELEYYDRPTDRPKLRATATFTDVASETCCRVYKYVFRVERVGGHGVSLFEHERRPCSQAIQADRRSRVAIDGRAGERGGRRNMRHLLYRLSHFYTHTPGACCACRAWFQRVGDVRRSQWHFVANAYNL